MEDDGGYRCGKDERVTGSKLVVYGEFLRTKEMPEEYVNFLNEFGKDENSIDRTLLDHIEDCESCFNSLTDTVGIDLALRVIRTKDKESWTVN
tara:strand:- start:1145 stop:1423 length:279 start_codon:yes stop_codon:yes gene_type:complete